MILSITFVRVIWHTKRFTPNTFINQYSTAVNCGLILWSSSRSFGNSTWRYVIKQSPSEDPSDPTFFCHTSDWRAKHPLLSTTLAQRLCSRFQQSLVVVKEPCSGNLCCFWRILLQESLLPSLALLTSCCLQSLSCLLLAEIILASSSQNHPLSLLPRATWSHLHHHPR